MQVKRKGVEVFCRAVAHAIASCAAALSELKEERASDRRRGSNSGKRSAGGGGRSAVVSTADWQAIKAQHFFGQSSTGSTATATATEGVLGKTTKELLRAAAVAVGPRSSSRSGGGGGGGGLDDADDGGDRAETLVNEVRSTNTHTCEHAHCARERHTPIDSSITL